MRHVGKVRPEAKEAVARGPISDPIQHATGAGLEGHRGSESGRHLGQHNEQIYRKRLGCSKQEPVELQGTGIIWGKR